MRTLVAGVALLALTACVGPSRSDADYKAKAANTAEAIASSVNTVRVGIDALRANRVQAAYLSRLVAEAEEDALSAQQAFDSVQPPSGTADDVHDRLQTIEQDALDALHAVRVAVRRGHDAEAIGYADALAQSAEKLRKFEEDPGA
jgi:ABC-type amino acid transport substrate-binding protein